MLFFMYNIKKSMSQNGCHVKISKCLESCENIFKFIPNKQTASSPQNVSTIIYLTAMLHYYYNLELLMEAI